MWRIVLGCPIGVLASTFTMALTFGMLACFNIGPIGQFIHSVIPQIMQKQAFDDYSLKVMHKGLVFALLVISPLSSLIGSLVGTVVSSTRGAWVGLIAALPIAFMVPSGRSDGALRVLSVLLCLAIGVVTGYTLRAAFGGAWAFLVSGLVIGLFTHSIREAITGCVSFSAIVSAIGFMGFVLYKALSEKRCLKQGFLCWHTLASSLAFQYCPAH